MSATPAGERYGLGNGRPALASTDQRAFRGRNMPQNSMICITCSPAWATSGFRASMEKSKAQEATVASRV